MARAGLGKNKRAVERVLFIRHLPNDTSDVLAVVMCWPFLHSQLCGAPMKVRFQRESKFCILHFETENEQDLRELLCTIPNVRGCHAILIPSPSKVVASITLKADYAGAWTLTNEKR